VTATVDGLISDGLKLTLGAETVSVPAQATSAVFATTVTQGNPYAVAVAAQPTGLTCALANGAGTAAAADVEVAVSCARNTYGLKGAVSGLAAAGLVLANGDERLPLAGGAAALAFQTPVGYGLAYAVTVATQPLNQTCTIARGTGTMGAADVTDIAVTCVDNVYRIGGTIAALHAAGLMLFNGSQNLTVAAGATSFQWPPSVNAGAAYTVTVKRQPTGQVCKIVGGTGTGTVGNGDVASIQVACRNDVAVVQDEGNGRISTYAMADDGLVQSTPLATVPGLGSHGLERLVFSSDGHYAYAPAKTGGQVLQFAVDDDGVVTGLAASATPNGYALHDLVLTGDGKFAYGPTQVGISEFIVGPYHLLSPLGPPGSVAAGSNPWRVAATPDGHFLYCMDNSDNTITQYAVGTDGTLTVLSPKTVATGQGPQAVVVDAAGKTLYVLNGQDGTVGLYRIGLNGRLSPLGAPVVAGGGTGRIVLSADGQTMYVSNYGGPGTTIWQFAVAPDGTLTPLANPVVTVPESFITDMAPSPDATMLYATTDSAFVAFSVGADGGLTRLDATPVGNGVEATRLQVR
jgi:hypothetical protein